MTDNDPRLKRLEHAEALLDRGRYEQALATLEGLFADPGPDSLTLSPVTVRAFRAKTTALVNLGAAQEALKNVDRLRRAFASVAESDSEIRQAASAGLDDGLTICAMLLHDDAARGRGDEEVISVLAAKLRLLLALRTNHKAIAGAADELAAAAAERDVSAELRVAAGYALYNAAAYESATGHLAEAQRTITKATGLAIADTDPDLTRHLAFSACYNLTELRRPEALASCESFIARYRRIAPVEVQDDVARVMWYRSLFLFRSEPAARPEAMKALDELIDYLRDRTEPVLLARLATALERKIAWLLDTRQDAQALSVTGELRDLFTTASSDIKSQIAPLLVDVQAALVPPDDAETQRPSEMLAIGELVLREPGTTTEPRMPVIRARAKWYSAVALQFLGRFAEAQEVAMEFYDMGQPALDVLSDFEMRISNSSPPPSQLLVGATASLGRVFVLVDLGREAEAQQLLEDFVERFSEDETEGLPALIQLAAEVQRELLSQCERNHSPRRLGLWRPFRRR